MIHHLSVFDKGELSFSSLAGEFPILWKKEKRTPPLAGFVVMDREYFRS